MSGAAGNGVTWVHQPQRGPIAWGVAVLVAPTVPLLSFFALLFLLAMFPGDDNELPVVLSPVLWLVVGGLVAALGAGRISRGVGFGLLGGSVASLVLAVVAAYGGWG